MIEIRYWSFVIVLLGLWKSVSSCRRILVVGVLWLVSNVGGFRLPMFQRHSLLIEDVPLSVANLHTTSNTRHTVLGIIELYPKCQDLHRQRRCVDSVARWHCGPTAAAGANCGLKSLRSTKEVHQCYKCEFCELTLTPRVICSPHAARPTLPCFPLGDRWSEPDFESSVVSQPM
jgi:hypothetical protein